MGVNAPSKVPERQRSKVRYKMIGERKKELGIEGLCAGLPPQFARMLAYARNEIAYREKPDYTFLRSLLAKLMRDKGFPDDGHYDWDDLEDSEHQGNNEVSSTNKAVVPASPRT